MAMNKKMVVYGLLVLTFLVISISNVSAVYYFQEKRFASDNVSTYIWSAVTYDTFTSPDLLIFDHIASGNPLTSYVWYNTYVDTWNAQNPNYIVNHCDLTIQYSGVNEPLITIFNQTFTGTISNGKYFVKLKKGDVYYVNMSCTFNSSRLLEIPASFTIVSPTWECRECQFYNWNQNQIQLTKATTINNNVNTIFNYIGNLVGQLYSLFVVFMWILLIGIVLFSVGLLFVGVIWVYKLIARHT